MKPILLLLALLLPAGAASAQALSCRVPATIDRPRPDLPDRDQPRRNLPIGSYTLALTWTPQHCRGRAGERDRFQCAGANRFGFALHGLWPDGQGAEWPQYCRPTRLLTEAELRANLCMTPSVQLLQHEWAKHGTCMSREPADYFGQARRHYQRLRFPDMATLARRPLTAGALADRFARINPGWRADMMRVRLTRDGWLDELWLCMDRRQRPARCPAHQGGAEPGRAVRIWQPR